MQIYCHEVLAYVCHLRVQDCMVMVAVLMISWESGMHTVGLLWQYNHGSGLSLVVCVLVKGKIINSSVVWEHVRWVRNRCVCSGEVHSQDRSRDSREEKSSNGPIHELGGKEREANGLPYKRLQHESAAMWHFTGQLWGVAFHQSCTHLVQKNLRYGLGFFWDCLTWFELIYFKLFFSLLPFLFFLLYVSI